MDRGRLARNVSEFGRMYLGNRMGQAGLALLFIFIGMAALAPYLTPYHPMYTMQLANFRAKPQWLGPLLPPNLYLITDPGLPSVAALGEWSLELTGGSSASWTGSGGGRGEPPGRPPA